ncbi:type IX secretion system membrane protein PorP/SprF [Flavobacterium azooxidireducens]|uniref:Type IX secretion system membrane protein PorP/SprF n=1 Tax=Flavobacterium azooxidireducens TaxID=1871076 RepID=A0ABY4KBU0_9FLAO|nr:type IX secretion system membrane protein PorP/SprF [Flavobacterium azooxidireducens]UPQ78199.1 type IX secretion system membrane protein PorP/SprF [Flavobacterium azooxidireducens]
MIVVINKFKVCILFLLLTVTVANAQQDSQYTNYMYNTINVNPAYAGSRGVMSLFGMHRNQWVGLDGAPMTNVASINTPINNSNVGLGISFVNDRIGPSDENAISVDISYTIPISETYKLSFGVKGTANLLNVDYTKLNIYDPTDVQFQNNIDNRFSPNIGAGVYLHSDKLYAGISAPNFLETEHYDDNAFATAKERMHYYLIGGYVFDLSPSIKFKPAFLTKVVSGAPLQLDLTANFMFNEKFVLGAAWRWDAAVSGLAGFQVNENWMIGYAYDAETTKLANYNSGSHEIFLRYEFKGKKEKVVSPRFF